MDRLTDQQNEENLTVPLIDSGRQENRIVNSADGGIPATTAQDPVLSQFIEITHCSLQDARGILSSCDWNLEHALAVHLADDTRTGQSNLAATGTHHAGTSRQRQRIASSPDSHHSSTPHEAVESSNAGRYTICDSLLRWLTVIYTLIRDLIVALFSPTTPHTGTSNVPNIESPFGRYFRNRYGAGQSNFPNFYAGTLEQALSLARDRKAVFVGYVHCDLTRGSDDFCRNVLKASNIVTLLNDPDKFVLWASWESRPVAALLGCRRYPYFTVIDPRGYSAGNRERTGTINNNSYIATLEGDAATADRVIAAVIAGASHVDELRAVLSSPRGTEAVVEVDRALRREQDQEYKEALLLDNEKAEKKRVEAQEAQEKKEREQLRELRKKARIAETRKERKRIAHEFKTMEGDLSVHTDHQKTKICVLLPSKNTRIHREFNYSDDLSLVYKWTSALRYLRPDLVTASRQIPLAFTLCCRVAPNLERADRKATLEDLALVPNAVLLLRKASTGYQCTTGTNNNTTGTNNTNSDISDSCSDEYSDSSRDSAENALDSNGKPTDSSGTVTTRTTMARQQSDTGSSIKSRNAHQTKSGTDWRL